MPPGADATEPGPTTLTDTRCVVPARSNVALTSLAESTVSEQAPMPLQAPRQPANTEPGSGVPTRSTASPRGNDASQVAPQAMPSGVDVTVPAPLPALLMLICGSHGQGRSVSTAVSALRTSTQSGALRTFPSTSSLQD